MWTPGTLAAALWAATALKMAASALAPLVELNDGGLTPSFGLTTWIAGADKNAPEFAKEAQDMGTLVEAAIDAGYRLVDTAGMYATEEQVGVAVNKKIKEGLVKREDMFIITKLRNDRHAKAAVVPALEQSLDTMGMEYVDLYLMHWPVATSENKTIEDTDYLETWGGLIEAKKRGLTKSIGVGNFNKKQLQRLISESSEVPAMLQVELNLQLQQPELIEFCRDHNIVVTAFTPLGALMGSANGLEAPPPRASDPAMQTLAKKYNKNVPQVIFRYLHEMGVVPLPKPVTAEGTAKYIDIFDFELAQEDRDLMKKYDANFRNFAHEEWRSSPYYPFEKE